MMNEQENVLEERLALLMAGEPLEHCIQGLAEEEAELVREAAALQTMELPLPSETAVAEQRQLVLGKAQKTLVPSKTEESIPLLVKLQAFLKGLNANREVGLGLAFLLLVIFFFAWFGFRTTDGNGSQIANLEGVKPPASQAEMAQESTNPATAEEESAQTEASELAAQDAAIAGGSNNIVTFMPIVSMPLFKGPEQAVIHQIQGLVEIQTPGAEWTAVTANINVPAGSRVRTAVYSRAAISFYDGSQAKIGPASELSLDTVNALLPAQGFRTIVMTQWAGSSDHQVQHRNDRGSLYEVKSMTGSGIARGTQFHVEVESNGRAHYTVHEGKVDVSNSSRTVSVIAGQTTNFSEDEPPEPPAFLVSGTGIVTEMGETWIIAGQPFIVNDSTQINGDPQIGDRVHVEGHLNEAGAPVADQIDKLADAAEDEFTLTGQVEAVGDESWTVSGQIIQITAETDIEPDIQIGDTVRVLGIIGQPEGSLIATQIQIVETDDGLPFEFTGIVQTISDSEWIISGITIAVDAGTEIEDGIAVGDTVKVEGFIEADDIWLAHEIKLVEVEQATFSFTGDVMSLSPWLVAGITFDMADWAVIEPGIEVGDRVLVQGIILEDGTWLAEEITLLSTDLLQIVFVGEVGSIDPWVVNGLPLQTDDATLIEGEIAEGDLVRVTAWIRDDGTWLATHIQLLDLELGEGCVSITAVITGINGDQIILDNGQTIILSEDLIIDGELSQGVVVLIVACVQADGTIDIVSITVIYDPADVPPPPPPPGDDDDDDDDDGGNNGGSVTICHKPGTPAEQTKTLPQSALGGHLGHGDTLGACGN